MNNKNNKNKKRKGQAKARQTQTSSKYNAKQRQKKASKGKASKGKARKNKRKNGHSKGQGEVRPSYLRTNKTAVNQQSAGRTWGGAGLRCSGGDKNKARNTQYNPTQGKKGGRMKEGC